MHNNLPPVLPTGDEPAVQTTMAHFEDNGLLSMIREEIIILKVLEGVSIGRRADRQAVRQADSTVGSMAGRQADRQ